MAGKKPVEPPRFEANTIKHSLYLAPLLWGKITAYVRRTSLQPNAIIRQALVEFFERMESEKNRNN